MSYNLDPPVVKNNQSPRFHQFVSRHKQDEIITELKAKEAEMLRQMQKSPKQFDPSKFKIDIECSEPGKIASGMRFNIKNSLSVCQSGSHSITQPVISEQNIPTNSISRPDQNTQEKFQKT